MSTVRAVRITLHLEADLQEALRLNALRGRQSMSDLVNEALRRMLRDDEEDLAVARSRAREKALGYEEFLGRLKVQGRR
jgi:Arc/MetJ-type ribon-helix-helix transcriptional regulator